ncbi:universal stress protein [Sphingobacterium thalpophilum]|uniref:Universal stress protein n=1 Tax=Sphingobacterium thalpophilum TaxID=259 RepID=A0A4U9V5C0_9SPHI|nr:MULTISPECIES: universal stress protein [Sphingobacterium]MCW8312836.1 universal stress protein [Sphingobacterium sp. InxBP1]VTR41745.1 Universal stress protein family [Sphingobacterium thalpophilum]
MKRIIVATDYAAEAEHALNFILEVFDGKEYELVLFSLQNPSIHAMNARLSPDTLFKMFEHQNKILQRKAEAVTAQHGITTIPYLATGLFYDQITKCIQETNADLLVMGMAKRSFDQDMLGNTTTAAISKLKIPILSVPLGAEFTGLKHILFACDIVRGVQKEILEKVKNFAAEFDATLEVLNIRKTVEQLNEEKGKETREAINNVMGIVSYYYKNVTSNEVVKAIRDEVKVSHTDLLVMIPYKYGFWSSLTHRSKTRMMASGLDVPLLTISI